MTTFHFDHQELVGFYDFCLSDDSADLLDGLRIMRPTDGSFLLIGSAIWTVETWLLLSSFIVAVSMIHILFMNNGWFLFLYLRNPHVWFFKRDKIQIPCQDLALVTLNQIMIFESLYDSFVYW